MTLLSIEISKSYPDQLESMEESDIPKLISSYRLTKKWLLSEFAMFPFCLNQANILWMVGSKKQIASKKLTYKH